MFWNRPTNSTPHGTPTRTDVSERVILAGERAIDLVGAILTTVAEHPMTVGDVDGGVTKEQALAWRAHLMTGAVHPETKDIAATMPQRDWAGARRFLHGLRRAEVASVEAVQRRFRDALWDVLQAVMDVYKTDRAVDEELSERLGRLTELQHSAASDEFRREALETVGLVRSRLDQRGSKHSNVIAALGTRLRSLQAELEEARGEMKRDALTRVFNRAGLDAELVRVERMAALLLQPASLLMVDIDHFKSVNDQYGHPAGDQVLTEVAARIVRSFPRKRDVVARFGGEEFAVILHDTNAATAGRLADRLLDAIRGEVFQAGDHRIDVSVSIGIAEIEPGESSSTWVARADAALYEAKRSGRDRARVAPTAA